VAAISIVSLGGSPKNRAPSLGFRPESSGDVEKFYLEAEFSARRPGDEATVEFARGWYQEPSRWRWEVTLVDADGNESEVLQVSDGRMVIHHEKASGTFYRQPVAAFLASSQRAPDALPGLPVRIAFLASSQAATPRPGLAPAEVLA